MSLTHLTWCFNHSPYKLGMRLVHLALADTANDDYDGLLWASQATIARKAGVSRGTVNTSLARMVEDGWLEEVTAEESQSIRSIMRDPRANVYRFRCVQIFDTSGDAMCTNEGGGCVQTTEPPPITNTRNPRARSPRKPETPFPEGKFRITEDMHTWAVTNGFEYLDLVAETHKFKDNAIARGRLYRDWVAAWRTWIRREAGYTPRPNTNPAHSDDMVRNTLGEFRP